MKFSRTDLIAYAAILIIVVSLASIGMKFTGYDTVTDTGVVNVTVSSSAAINFTTDFVNFGAGSVTDGSAGATINTETTVTGGDWSATSTGLVIENIGNVNVSLGLKADKAAAAYLGGTSPTFKYKVNETSGNTGSCAGNTASSYTSFTTGDVEVCPVFEFNDSKDEIDIDIEIYIPSDSNIGELTATITATGTY